MNKRGLSHLEVIFAFIIFIGFLILALVFFNPIDTDRVLDSSLIYSFNEVNENTSIQVTTYSINLRPGLPETVTIPITDEIPSENVKVEDYEGNQLDANYEDNNLIVNRGGEEFIVVRFGDIFVEENLQPTAPITNLDFNITSSDTREFLSEVLVENLKASYELDYRRLKEDFNLPGRIDFAFAIEFDDLQITADIGAPENIPIVVKEDRLETIRKDESITFSDLKIKVW